MVDDRDLERILAKRSPTRSAACCMAEQGQWIHNLPTGSLAWQKEQGQSKIEGTILQQRAQHCQKMPTKSTWVDSRPQHKCNHSSVKGLITCRMTVSALLCYGYGYGGNLPWNVANVVVIPKNQLLLIVKNEIII